MDADCLSLDLCILALADCDGAGLPRFRHALQMVHRHLGDGGCYQYPIVEF